MRRVLGLAAAAAAAAAFVLPASSANAYFCYTYVHGLCVGPCSINYATEVVTGGPIMYC